MKKLATLRSFGSLALVCAACAAPPGRTAPPPPSPSTPPPPALAASAAPTPVSEPKADAGSDAAPAPPEPEAVACAKLAWADVCVERHAFADAAVDDASAWFTSRHAKPPQFDITPECHQVAIGPAHEAALLCESIVHEARGRPGSVDQVYRVTVHLTVYVVRAARAVRVFDAPTLVDLLDKDEPSGPLFALGFRLADDGSELVLSEPAPGACTSAASKLDEDLATAKREHDPDARNMMLAWARFDRDLAKKLCDATGSYRFEKGRFVRPKPATGGASAASGP